MTTTAGQRRPLRAYLTRLLMWDKTHGHRFTHDFFKFPGKFHPPIVESLLHLFRPRFVVDPMAGVGTVAVEAKAAGIPSLSIDVDPLSVFFARVKTTPIRPDTLEAAWETMEPLLKRVRRSQEVITQYQFDDITTNAMMKHLRSAKARHMTSLIYWFRRYVLADYARLDHGIANGGLPRSSRAVHNFFKACLLATVRRISNADPYPVSGLEITKHMRERLAAGYAVDVAGEFERRVRMNIDRMANYVEYLRDAETLRTRADIVQDDCLSIGALAKDFGQRPDLILFSPPYCNAIEYWRRHRLEYFLGGFLTRNDIPDHHKRFVGRRVLGRKSAAPPPRVEHTHIDGIVRALHKRGRTAKAWQLYQYFDDMKGRMRAFYDALPHGGHAVLVVGNSQTAGQEILTVQALRDLALTCGFRHQTSVRYTIKNRTMQYPLREGDAKIATEAIVVLRRK